VTKSKKPAKDRQIEDLTLEIERLKGRLEESQELIGAIREGRVDALVAYQPEGEQIYTMKTADRGYRNLVENMGQGAVILFEEDIFYCNRCFADMIKRSRESITGSRFTQYISAEDHLKTRDFIQSAGKNNLRLETFIVSDHDNLVPVFLAVTPLTVGGFSGTCVVVTDLTEQKRTEKLLREIAARKRAQNALQESEQRYRAIARNLPQAGVFVVDHDLRYLLAEGEALKLANMKSEDLEGKTIFEVVDLETAALYEPFYRTALAGETFELEHQSHGHDFMTRGAPLYDTSGSIYAALAVSYDITERKRAEEALQNAHDNLEMMVAERTAELSKSEERFRALASASSEVIYRMNPDWSEMLELQGREFLAETRKTRKKWLEKYIHPDDQPHVRAAIEEAIKEKRVFELEHRVKRADGTLGWTFSRAVPLFNEKGEIAEWFGAAGDITRRKKMEQALKDAVAEGEVLTEQLRTLTMQLMVAERNERERIARILHDHLQQLLVGAKIQLEFLSQSMAQDAQRRLEESIQMIADSLKMSRSLTEELAPQALQYTNVAKALEWVCSFAKKTHDLNVELAVDDEVEVPNRDMRSFLCLSVQELLFNVVKHSGVQTARVRLGKDADGNLQAAVSDSGKGFDPALLNKEQTLGNQYGLFSIQQRLRSLEGSMQLESSPGKGASFTLIMPVMEEERSFEEPLETRISKSPDGRFKAGGEGEISILVVDDHKIVRQGLVQMLVKEPDIQVVGEAENGVEAVEMACKLNPNVILMDINMPEMDGIEATRTIHSELPDVRIIGLSMHNSKGIVDDILAAGAADFLSKESSSKIVLETVRKRGAKSKQR